MLLLKIAAPSQDRRSTRPGGIAKSWVFAEIRVTKNPRRHHIRQARGLSEEFGNSITNMDPPPSSPPEIKDQNGNSLGFGFIFIDHCWKINGPVTIESLLFALTQDFEGEDWLKQEVGLDVFLPHSSVVWTFFWIVTAKSTPEAFAMQLGSLKRTNKLLQLLHLWVTEYRFILPCQLSVFQRFIEPILTDLQNNPKVAQIYCF